MTAAAASAHNELPPRRRRRQKPTVIEIAGPGFAADDDDTRVAGPDVMVQLAEAEDTLRAIAAGEVDAFVVSDGRAGRRVFTLSTADRPYRRFVENMRDGAVTLSANGIILYVNRRVAELLGRPRDQIIGSHFESFLTAGTTLSVAGLHGPSGRGRTVELELVDADGALVPVLVGASQLDVEGDQLVCLTLADLSEQKAQDRLIAQLSLAQEQRMAELQDAQTALTKQATHDTLTGLPNRALFIDRVEQALAQARRTGALTAVLFVDLDRFKQINDTKGHAAGDSVLRSVAEQLIAGTRSMDTVARIGGDEFVILAVDVDSRVRAADIGMRLVAALSQAVARCDAEGISASVGLTVSFSGEGTAETLLAEADTAMYEAKSFGGRQVGVFDAALRRQVEERSLARGMLQSALDEQRIIAHYQPIVDLSTRRVAGFEALARLTQLDGSIVGPYAFIPAAEESGLIVPLGTHMLHVACQEAASWAMPDHESRALTVAVNLSSRQLEPGDLVTVVRRALETAELQPACLHLELTETAIIDLRPDTIDQLDRVRDLGVELGLDDFGTGYASLTHLRKLPLTFVKIDRSFVQGLETNHEDRGIVRAIVELAASLGLRSIAEGVETDAQRRHLLELGCDHAQGHLFARPVPAALIPSLTALSALPPSHTP
jgi:diguanylate cyclase (GGDEF)-like protein/PAS domain S-box-containing protein